MIGMAKAGANRRRQEQDIKTWRPDAPPGSSIGHQRDVKLNLEGKHGAARRCSDWLAWRRKVPDRLLALPKKWL